MTKMALLICFLSLVWISLGNGYSIQLKTIGYETFTSKFGPETITPSYGTDTIPTNEPETPIEVITTEAPTSETIEYETFSPTFGLEAVTLEVITTEATTSGTYYNHGTCGKQSSGAAKSNLLRIVGGTTASSGKWPWQIAILEGNGGKPIFNADSFCGGTIINSKTILTAAHCFPNYDSSSKFYVRIGDNDREKFEDQEEIIGATRIILHQRYDASTNENDIALMILEKEMVFKDRVNAACLPDVNEDMLSCVITGWGDTAEKGSSSATLQEATVPIVPRRTCAKAYTDEDGTTSIYENMICAGYAEGGIDSCQGDSGGPLTCKNSEEKYVVRGVVSFGDGCARAEKYGVYTDVFKYMTWIKRHL